VKDLESRGRPQLELSLPQMDLQGQPRLGAKIRLSQLRPPLLRAPTGFVTNGLYEQVVLVLLDVPGIKTVRREGDSATIGRSLKGEYYLLCLKTIVP
jgi:hypothetical protein